MMKKGYEKYITLPLQDNFCNFTEPTIKTIIKNKSV